MSEIHLEYTTEDVRGTKIKAGSVIVIPRRSGSNCWLAPYKILGYSGARSVRAIQTDFDGEPIEDAKTVTLTNHITGLVIK